MSSLGAPQQHKQPSRKGKKAWRKNVDITEVQDGLENLREAVIQGGPLSEKKAEEIFAVDTIGSTEIKKKHNLNKPLKVDEILARRSAVPVVDGRKRSVSKLTDGVVEESSSKRLRGDWVSKKEVQRLKKSINTVSRLGNDLLVEDHDTSGFDLWSVEPTPQTITKELEYIPKPRAKVAPPTIKQAPIPMTASGRPVQAVKNPDAGISYNPSFEEWDKLLTREGEREIAAEKVRLAQAAAEAEKQARIAAITAAATAEAEAGGRTDDESAWEGFETENSDGEKLRKKRPTRKTPSERNKIKRRQQVERLARHERNMTADRRKQAQQIEEALSAGTISQATGDQALARLEAQQVDSDSDTDDTRLRRRRMGPTLIPARNLELVLPDELQESLRQLKPEGNLLQDRFRHLLVNGKIESRKPVLQHKKKRVKYTEKWSHKDFSIEV